MARHHTCDICGQPATMTIKIRVLPLGARPILIGMETATHLRDLCDEHGAPLKALELRDEKVASNG